MKCLLHQLILKGMLWCCDYSVTLSLKLCLAFTVKVYTLRSGLALKGPGGNIGLAATEPSGPVPMPVLRSYLFSSVQACIYLYPQPAVQLVVKRVIEECCKQPVWVQWKLNYTSY